MNTKIQAKKNLKLSEKVADFLINNPEVSKKLPRDASFIAFSADDKNLNEVNNKLIEGLLEEGKHVVKAQEIKSDHNSWKFFPVSL